MPNLMVERYTTSAAFMPSETQGYPTQKPVALYERMIKASAINMTSCLTRSLAVARHLTQRTRSEGTG